MKDDKLWKVFSEYIRLRDADENGYCVCCTSGQRVHWKECDAGHFISRDKKATKYHEQNVHAQNRNHNRFRSGEQFLHGKFIDNKYGPGTADKLLMLSRQPYKLGQFEIDQLTKYYREKVKELKKLKAA
jgi:hypothetical protein